MASPDPYLNRPGALADGAPASPAPTPAGRRRRTGPSPIAMFEGPRGHATRASVWVRYGVYLATVLLCSGLVHGLLAGTPWRSGGRWMLFAASLTATTAAIGTIFYANNRNELIEQARHYLFGLMLLPATGLALVLAATASFLGTSGDSDVLASLFSNALPVLFFMTVAVPPMIFIKVVAGLRTIHRSKMDDEEMVHLWTRQDGYQR